MISEDRSLAPNPRNVFVNVPYDAQYGPLFTAIITCLAGLGFIPRCGLETQSGGTDRLRGIFELISCCGASIHDLSRMDLSGTLQVPRFNMPFELGIAYALQSRGNRQGRPRHKIYVFDERRRRLEAALSDMAGFDPLIHRGTQEGILYAILDCFDPQTGPPDDEKLKGLVGIVSEEVLGLQRKRGLHDPFSFSIFRQIIDIATRRAEEDGLLAAGSPPHPT